MTLPLWHHLASWERTTRPIRCTWGRIAAFCSLATLVCPGVALRAQEVAKSEPDTLAPVVDSIAIVTENVFTPTEAENTGIFRLANGLRVKTQRWVVEREVLLQAGQPYDSALADETERNLRSLGLFRQVDVDTATVDGKLLTKVHTRDAWSTKPTLELNIASDGAWTGRVGITESNVLGTGNYGHAAWRKDVDRDGFEFGTVVRRLAGSEINAGGQYFALSDGKFGDWFAGDPWRSFNDDYAVFYDGQAGARQLLRYYVESSEVTDTTRYWRSYIGHRLIAGVAARATSRNYTRIGIVGEYRKQKYVLVADTSMAIPDTAQGFVGVFGEYRRSHYMVARFLNGFATEDIDLSDALYLGLNLAHNAFGYEQTGLGPSLAMQAGAEVGSGFVHGVLEANGLFNSAGLDSGRVVVRATFAQKPGERHATLLHAVAGMLQNPPPGGEFDLGFEFPPRSWSPHSFVGTRTMWATLEHRWYVFDRVLNLFGIGVAGFVDYGGAWYANQPARWGGAAGIGLRTGSSRGSVVDTGRIDLGYRFGSDVTGSRWVISFGGGWIFP